MNSEEFAPFESIGLGSVDSGAPETRGNPNVFRLLVECLTLTVRTSPRWISLGLLSGGLVALLAYCIPEVDSGTALFTKIVPLLFLLPATLASTYRILLASKRKEKLGFMATLGYGLSRSVRMLATGVVLNLAFVILYAVMTFIIVGLCTSDAGTYLGVPLAVLCFIVAVYMGLRWQLAAVVCVVENRSFFQVLQRSYALSEGKLGFLTLTNLGAGLLGFIAIGLADVGAQALAIRTMTFGPLGYDAVVLLLAGMLPLTANFLCYYYLSGGQVDSTPLPEAGDDPIGLSRE